MKLILKVYELLKEITKQGLLRLSMLLIFLIAVIQFFGCYSLQQTGPTNPTFENKPINTFQEKVEEERINNIKITDPELERNRSMWLEKNIVNYNITVSAYQGGNVIPADSVLIEIRDGKGTLIEPTPKVDKVRLEVYKVFDTVEKMFDAIQQGFEEEAIVEVKYNKKFGYPEEMYVNYYQKGSDQYKRIKIKKFEIVGK